MKLRRFNAPDIRQAIKQVREALGSDAVILSNRPADGGGVEIIAAIDYDDAILDGNTEAIAKTLPKDDGLHTNYVSEIEDLPVTPAMQRAAQISESLSARVKSKAEPISQADTETMAWLKKFGNNAPEQTTNKDLNSDNASLSEPVKEKSENVKHAFDDQPEIQNVWNELHSLRGLLEQQLSSFAWTDVNRRYPSRARAVRRLLEYGLAPSVTRRLLQKTPDDESFEHVWKQSLTELAKSLPVLPDDVIMQGGVFALVGPTGVGKTTTLAKIAARFALQNGTKDIALVTTDNYRVGAQEQLRTYGRILETPVRVANDAQELKTILKSLYDKKLVLIDTAGMSQRDIRLTEQFGMLSEGSSLIKTFLVFSAATQMSVLDETINAYQKVVLDGCVLTKLDESTSLGGALSVVTEHKLPIAYISDGQRVPEDLHRETAVALIKRGLEMMKKSHHPIEDEVVELAFGGLVANDLG